MKSLLQKNLSLKPEPISTQIIPRDRHAYFFNTLALIASSAERLATEVRHLQRTEVLEAEEYFSSGQKGSSAMPHKRNPVLSEIKNYLILNPRYGKCCFVARKRHKPLKCRKEILMQL